MTDTTTAPTIARRNRRPGHGGYLRDPRDTRTGEQIGAGFVVFRRGERTGRIRPPEWPYEHPTLDAAKAECRRLTAQNPGQTFEVWARVVTMLEAADTTQGADPSRAPACGGHSAGATRPADGGTLA